MNPEHRELAFKKNFDILIKFGNGINSYFGRVTQNTPLTSDKIYYVNFRVVSRPWLLGAMLFSSRLKAIEKFSDRWDDVNRFERHLAQAFRQSFNLKI